MFYNQPKKLMIEHKKIVDEFYNKYGPSELEVMISENTKEDAFGYIIARESSRDEFMKQHYLSKMRKVLRNGADINSYLFGIMYAVKIKRYDLVEEFENKMIDIYPLDGRSIRFFIPFMRFKFFNPYLTMD